MKRLFLAVSIVLLFTACDDEPMSNQELLIGTWEDTWEDVEGEISKQRFIFTASGEFEDNSELFIDVYDPEHPMIKIGRKPQTISSIGSYQATDSTIILFFDKIITDSVERTLSDFPPVTRNYSITKNELTMTIRENSYTYKRIN